MKRFSVFILLLFLASHFSYGQVKKSIKKSRRNKTESQLALPENYLQMEWEGGIEKINDNLSTIVHPNLSVRYGLTKKVELNLESSWVTARQKNNSITNITSGIEPLMPGVAWYPFEETANRPAMGISLQLGVPFLAGKSFTADHLAPTLQMTLQKSIYENIQMAFSGGAYWDGFNRNPSFVYLISPSWQEPKWNAALEFFGYINGTAPLHNADINLMYSLTKRFQVGFTAGTGLSAAAHKSYFALNLVNGFFTSSKHLQ